MSIISAKDDLLHAAPNDHYTWTETNWFGLMAIPEERLQFEPYVWLHPNLKVAYAGFYAASGVKKDQLACEYWDFRSWLPFPAGNLDEYRLDNGLSVKILKPLTAYQIDYVDAERKTELHVTWDATMPPVPFPMGEHLEQTGRVRGALVLDGRERKVDFLSIRDHSWVFRPETPKMGRRPIAMVSCGFDPEFSVCLTLPDSAYTRSGAVTEAPGWLAQASVKPSEFVPFCWVQKGSSIRQVRSAWQRTTRDPTGFRPTRVEAEFVDDHDEKYTLTGEVVNMVPFHWMQNNMIRTCLTRFECNGRNAWGNFAESLENDVVRELLTQ
ncbi:MAG TPA: hypothetical protein VJQ47_04735 [Steroidobacteraceae bacterium]|nr:hypothetical protein [Steroidobacteraceae bacterium]